MKNDKIIKNLNKPLLILMLIYAIGGAFLILNASSISSVLIYGTDTPYYFFERQLIIIGVSLVLSYFIIKVPTSFYKVLSLFATLGCFGLLIMAYGSSLIRSGIQEVSVSLSIGRFQPAEFLKVFLVMYMGSFYGIWANIKHRKWSFIIPLILCFLGCLIIALGGDLGSAAIMVALFALVFVAVPSDKEEKIIKWLKVLAIVGLVLSIVFLKIGYKILPESKLSSGRFNRFIYRNPCDRYEENSGYQVCNGFIAINNGGIFGSGIGASVQKYLYLPASHTDFIFPIIVEELGVLFGILIILGYVYIAYLIFKIASRTYKLQNSLICYGIGLYFILHIFVNLCGVLGMLPLTGVPLPFLSYGGSFCMALICSFAVVQRIHIENVIEKNNREIKKIVNNQKV